LKLTPDGVSLEEVLNLVSRGFGGLFRVAAVGENGV
jgi:hypothetical protein